MQVWLTRELKITNSHTSVLFNVLIKDGLVEYTSKNQEINILKLTKEGKRNKKNVNSKKNE